jgi:ATP-dependent DNA ligase
LRVSDEKIPLYHRDDGYVSDVKLDGARYILHHTLDGVLRAYSRGVSVRGGLVDKSGQLAHLLEDLKTYWPPGTVLDGEVFVPGFKKSFKQVLNISGATPEEAKRRQERSGQWLQYYCFDILAEEGVDYTSDGEALYQEDRWAALKRTFDGFGGSLNNLHCCNPVFGTEAKAVHLRQNLAAGYEGSIYKQLTGLYTPGKRDKRWVKDKPQRDYQVVFTGVEWAKLESIKKGETQATPTRFIEMARQHGFDRIVGAITYGQLTRCTSLITSGGETPIIIDGTPYELRTLGKCSGIDDATRLEITAKWEQYKVEFRCFDIRAQSRHEATLALREPQFDRWRDDLSISDCVVEEE